MQARFLTFVCLIAATVAVPVFYDQRQDGGFNVAADVQNVVFLIAYPKKMSMLDLDDFFKSQKPHNRDSDIQERADHVMEAFVEPNTPYRVDIGSNDRAEGDGRAVEVVIAGRRRLGPEPLNENETEADEIKTEVDEIKTEADAIKSETGELKNEADAIKTESEEIKLIGATEQCGPERERDPVTLTCRFRAAPASQPEPVKDKVIPEPTPEAVPQVVPS